MGYTKKTLQELDLIDNFLSNAIASNKELSGPFYRLLLSVLLGKELRLCHAGRALYQLSYVSILGYKVILNEEMNKIMSK